MKGEREREEGYEAGRVGYSGRERGCGRGGDQSPCLGLSIKHLANPAGIPKMLHQGHVALGLRVPALAGCSEVRASEPAVGTYYPHNRCLDQTQPCPCVHRCQVYQERPVISVSLSDPPSME